jgi:hypothetical protein
MRQVMLSVSLTSSMSSSLSTQTKERGKKKLPKAEETAEKRATDAADSGALSCGYPLYVPQILDNGVTRLNRSSNRLADSSRTDTGHNAAVNALCAHMAFGS